MVIEWNYGTAGARSPPISDWFTHTLVLSLLDHFASKDSMVVWLIIDLFIGRHIICRRQSMPNPKEDVVTFQYDSDGYNMISLYKKDG